MRSFFGFVVVTAAVVAVLVFVVAPLVARPLIASLVRDALPIDDGAVTVEVDVSPALLSGEVDALTIAGRDLRSGDATIGLLQVELASFNLVSRAFKVIDGRLEDVEVRLADGTAVSLERIDVSGPSDALRAAANLDAAAVEGLVRSKLEEQGIRPDAMRLGDDAIEVDAQGVTIRARISVHDGGLYLEPDRLIEPLAVLEYGQAGPWLVIAATLAPAGLVVEATTQLEAMLGG
jgi:hypothetical protein